MNTNRTSAQSELKVSEEAEDTMLEPFPATVNGVVDTAPVPSLIITLSPIEGELGNVMVMPPAPTTMLSPAYTVRSAVLTSRLGSVYTSDQLAKNRSVVDKALPAITLGDAAVVDSVPLG